MIEITEELENKITVYHSQKFKISVKSEILQWISDHNMIIDVKFETYTTGIDREYPLQFHINQYGEVSMALRPLIDRTYLIFENPDHEILFKLTWC